MKQQINEFKRMQLIAGLITESEYRESQMDEANSSSKYINRGRLNKNAVADYLKSVIDPEYLKDVNTFMRDEEGWGESSSYFLEDDESPLGKLLEAVGKYKNLGQNSDNPLWKALDDATFNIINNQGKLRPKGKAVAEKILSDFGVLDQYQQYVDDLEKPKLEPTDKEVEDWARQELSYYLTSQPDEFPFKEN
jgi:hypothetical protein